LIFVRFMHQRRNHNQRESNSPLHYRKFPEILKLFQYGTDIAQNFRGRPKGVVMTSQRLGIEENVG